MNDERPQQIKIELTSKGAVVLPFVVMLTEAFGINTFRAMDIGQDAYPLIPEDPSKMAAWFEENYTLVNGDWERVHRDDAPS